MIDQETIQRIMDATRIEEVIGEFVSMKRRGANYVGCCPFHNEKTPSFSVSPAKGIYKCFGCGESGNTVGFLMKHEHYTYPEALRWLAAKYNIEIVEEELTDEQKERNNERDALFHVSEFAQKYFADLLYNDEMGAAVGLSYFHSRGLTDNVIKAFGLGYCLDEWDAFTKHARSNGYSDNVLGKTGLSIFKDDGKVYDRFRARVMFPIYSVSGRVLGFSGRILQKEKSPAKYVNSPDSEIFSKSHILYGLYQAKSAISKQDKCYLVEGNIDVISMFQSGVENTVASCGTSLTIEQVRLMRRYTKNITVLYDGDSAGIKAAFRAVNMLFEEGMHVRVVLFPDGEDPDSYAQKYGSAKLQEYLAENESNFILFKTKVLAQDIKGDPIKKAEVLGDIVRTIALVPDLMERAEYVKQCASLLKIPEETLQNELAKTLNRKLYEAMNHKPDPNDKDIRDTESGETHLGFTDTTVEGERTEDGGEAKTRPVVTPFSLNPAQSQENKIVSLLLNYGDQWLEFESKNDKGEPQVEKCTVAQVIVGDLLEDRLTFDDAVCQQIFNIYAERINNGDSAVDTQIFVTSEDENLRNRAVAMMMTDYHVSDKWKDKMIHVPSQQERLRMDVEESLLTLKLKKLDVKIDDIDRQFAFVDDDEEKLMLVAQKMSLIKVRRQLGDALNRVIS
ncbi:MAG: DNA primase [Bacteroidales bacterium]|nr:DNA primase [Bacteroidales bacterium]